MSANATKIIVFASDTAARTALIKMLGAVPDIEILTDFSGLGSAASTASGESPDVVVVCLDTQQPDIADRFRDWRAVNPNLSIVVILGSDEVSEIPELLDAGVGGFILPATSAEKFVTAMRTVREGEGYLSLELLKLLCEPLRNSAKKPDAFGLTVREQQILTLIAVNMSNKDVARKLDLSVRTVETHRLNIRKKTNARNREELTRIAGQLGLLGKYPLPPGLAERKTEAGFHEE